MTAFVAPEYQADGSIRPAAYAFTGSTEDGWEVQREGVLHLRLGRGFRLLETSHCGVCSTDLARRHLPFPLPQVTGHEVVARDQSGAAVVVEINASHAARGLAHQGWCPYCMRHLGTHCPERRVLGIHDLLGGFSPWLLAPVDAVLPVPAAITPATATLVEPFAAALHAVQAIGPYDGDRVAVLGPRRLGSLVVAALAAWRRQSGGRYHIVAVSRRADLRDLATALGADETRDAATVGDAPLADVVVETTGSPTGLDLALRLASREVHVKSTTGQPTAGLAHLTALVVDELTIARWDDAGPLPVSLPSPRPETAVAVGDVPESIVVALRGRGLRVLTGADPVALVRELDHDPQVPLGAADMAVVTSTAAVDAVIRPRRGLERGLVRARGAILVADTGQPRDPLLAAVLDRGLRISASRCGDFRAALDLLANPATGLGTALGERLVRDRFPAERLAEAFARVADPASLKVVVTHPGTVL